MAKIYFHVDVNSAFLSWSALKALQDGGTVDLRTIPAVVGGDETKRHGVVLAKSGPAKQYGIKTGESLFAARTKCPGLTVVPPDFDWYVQNSKALIQILNDYTPDVEQYSIDEAFLDMTGTEALFGPPLTAAHTIRRRVRRELGFTVNVGIAPNRLLAKMASDFQKPDKVHTLYLYEVEKKMWPLPVGELFGVGPSAAKKLNSCGIYTLGNLAAQTGINPNTAQKAYRLMTEEGYVVTDGNSGSYLRLTPALREKIDEELTRGLVEDFVARAKANRLSYKKVIALVSELWDDEA